MAIFRLQSCFYYYSFVTIIFYKYDYKVLRQKPLCTFYRNQSGFDLLMMLLIILYVLSRNGERDRCTLADDAVNCQRTAAHTLEPFPDVADADMRRFDFFYFFRVKAASVILYDNFVITVF